MEFLDNQRVRRTVVEAAIFSRCFFSFFFSCTKEGNGFSIFRMVNQYFRETLSTSQNIFKSDNTSITDRSLSLNFHLCKKPDPVSSRQKIIVLSSNYINRDKNCNAHYFVRNALLKMLLLSLCLKSYISSPL